MLLKKPNSMDEAAGGLLGYMDEGQPAELSPSEYIRQMQMNSLGDQRTALDDTNSQLEKLRSQKKQTDLTPFAMGVDFLTGSSMAKQYQSMKPKDNKNEELLLKKLGAQQSQAITDDFMKMQGMDAKNDYMKTMSSLQRQKMNQKDEGLTVLEEYRDKEFGKNIDKDRADNVKSAANLNRLRDVSNRLGKNPSAYGPSAMPLFIRSFTDPESADAQQTVEFVAQQSLKKILGGQFSEKEGQQLIERTYNAKLPAGMRKQRLDVLIGQLDIALKEKQAAIDYVDGPGQGSLKGFKGGNYGTMEEYEEALKERLINLSFDDDKESTKEPDFDNMSVDEINNIGR